MIEAGLGGVMTGDLPIDGQRLWNNHTRLAEITEGLRLDAGGLALWVCAIQLHRSVETWP